MTTYTFEVQKVRNTLQVLVEDSTGRRWLHYNLFVAKPDGYSKTLATANAFLMQIKRAYANSTWHGPCHSYWREIEPVPGSRADVYGHDHNDWNNERECEDTPAYLA